jgi:predicted TIM-barrel fold metal-dependent hydrolase
LVNIKEAKQEILEYIESIKIVDQHEHLSLPFMREGNFENDLPYFLTNTYLGGDMWAIGFPTQSITPEKYRYLEKPLDEDQSEERWNELKPYLEKLRNTIYYRHLLIALRDLYGFEGEEVDDSNWRELSQGIREKSRNRLKWSLEVLDRMKVYKVILNIGNSLPNDKIINDERLVQVVSMDDFVRGNLDVIKKNLPESARSFGDYLNALDQTFEAAIKAGAVGVKSTLAYERSIFFENVAKADAERIFSKGLGEVGSQERRVFQDFMMHAVCDKCAEYNLPFQIHTGLQAGILNTLANAQPTLLTNLFQKFSDVRFDIFHGGYPYLREAGILAKYFPNVYLDACWLAHISPAAYRQALDEWIEVVPSNKIFAWGGDHLQIEHSYASLNLAKDLVSDVLAAKVASGYFGKKVAFMVAERIMGKNAAEVYNF